jgi:dihydropteroate synthase
MGFSINIKGTLKPFSHPLIMGIVNATPDSFYKGSRFSLENVEKRIAQMVSEGADILDVGGASSRPGAQPIPISEELKRVEPIIKTIRRKYPSILMSIDTVHAAVAERALELGVNIINDISFGEEDPEMVMLVGREKVPYIGMHKQGIPETMQVNPTYENVVAEVLQYLIERRMYFLDHGAMDVMVDPGLGFGKSVEHNYALLKNTAYIKNVVKAPILVGLSRKSMINKVLDVKADDALNGTTVLNTVALLQDADVLRVHDVKEAVEARLLIEALKKST